MPHPTELELNLLRRFNVGDLLQRSARRVPTAVALRFDGRDVRYGELADMAARVSRALLQAGVGPQDVVAALGLNSPEYVALWFGAASIGAVLLPLNALLRGRELTGALARARARALMVDGALWPLLAGESDPLESIVVRWFVGDPSATPPGFTPMGEALAAADEGRPDVMVPSEAPCTLLFTSGTEAQPKGVVGTHLNWHAALLSALSDLEIGRRQRMLLALPLFHVAGLYVMLATMATGATGILVRRIEPTAVLDAIEQERASYLVLPATAYVGLLAQPDLERRDLSSLARAIVFQYLPGSAMRRLRQLAPQVEWMGYWGQSELTPLGASTWSTEVFDRASRPDPIGHPHLPLEVRLVDEDDRDVPPGQVGEVVVRGPAVMAGYFEDVEGTAHTFRGGWHHTGDLAATDGDGFLYFVDRRKDIIKTGGENVSSQEVEEVVARHPGVAAVSVIGLPDPYWVEAVVAVVVAAAGYPDDLGPSILEHCRRELASFKVPKQVHVVDELPKSPAGKVLKRVLQQRFGGAE